MKRTIYDCWNCCHRNSDNPYGIDYCEVHDTRCSFANDDCDNFEPDTDTGGNNIQTEPPRRLTVIGWYLLAIVFAVLLGWLLMGCTTTKYVPMPEYHNDTVRVTQYQRDSIYMHDSILVRQQGDTVTIDRWHTQYRDRWHTDTIYKSRVDSVPYKVEVVKEIPAKLSWWERLRLNVSNVLLGVAVLVIILFFIIRLVK
jgi:hypothetical protein